MTTLEAPVRKAPPQCPWWCNANHGAGLHTIEEDRYGFRAHYGREQILPDVIDEEDVPRSAGVALIQVDNLVTGERGPAGVSTFNEGVLTPEQAMRFASMILAAATSARMANANGPAGLLPPSDVLRGR